MVGNKKNPESLKQNNEFVCFKCNYLTFHRGDWKKHIKTKKHLRGILETGKMETNPQNYKFVCKFCKEKRFKSRSGCWKHEQKCDQYPKQLIKLKKENMKWKKLALKEYTAKQKLDEENNSLKQKLLENQTGSTNIGTQNNTINVNLFLNEHCKNAIPILDFVRELQFTIHDINPDRPISSVESLSNVIVKKLSQLEDTKRPVHCSDAKRMKFYVKDASGWVKDDDNKKIDKAIGFANSRHQGAWHFHAAEEGLDCSVRDDYYLKMNVAMGEFSENVQHYKNKVKRAIAEATNIKIAKLKKKE